MYTNQPEKEYPYSITEVREKGKVKMKSATGSIRKVKRTRNGRQYTYWEARITTGYREDGAQIQRSVSGKTQKEVREKMTAIMGEVDKGSYVQPSEMTYGDWLTIWQENYFLNLKPLTQEQYKGYIRRQIMPALGSIKLRKLAPHDIQKLYANLQLSPKTIKNIHGVIHKSLTQAVQNRYISNNPADACIPPKARKPEIHPLTETEMAAFLKAIRGHRLENLFTVMILTGLRESEALGLTWDCVDLETGQITISKQLINLRHDASYELATPKNGMSRTIIAPQTAIKALKAQRLHQMEFYLLVGEPFPVNGFVFTDEKGDHLIQGTVWRIFKKIAAEIGRPDARVHDLRHTYAVAALRSGIDIKTLQHNLGHATPAFTLEVYGHASDDMLRISADRMDNFISQIV